MSETQQRAAGTPEPRSETLADVNADHTRHGQRETGRYRHRGGGKKMTPGNRRDRRCSVRE